MGWLKKLFAAARGTTLSSLPDNAMLVDVRSEGEFSGGCIEGAVSMPLERLHVDIIRLAPDRATPLVLYCRSGARSGRACSILAGLGYEQVANGGGIGGLSMSLNRPITARRG
jgi:phage shock protein E